MCPISNNMNRDPRRPSGNYVTSDPKVFGSNPGRASILTHIYLVQNQSTKLSQTDFGATRVFHSVE